jgi:glycosyltransferase involved in cell wall biosynthesis
MSFGVSMTEPLVSVILIGYQDEARIGRALTSIQAQTLTPLEIIVVDDASTDGTEDLIRAAMANDPRIRYERLPVNSGGCGVPRNTGLALARAPWVMFCDSDDELEMHACANLLDAAERTSADMVCGTAERIDVQSGEATRWRPDLHEETAVFTALDPRLLYDTIVPNKIFRRDLLVGNAIRFPEGVLFEDQPFTVACLLAAERVAAISPVVYRWYFDKGAEEGSITQGRAQTRNVRDRVTVNRLIDAMLVDRPDWQWAKAVKFLGHEGYLYLSTLLDASDESALAIVAEFNSYLRSIAADAYWQVRPMLRVAFFYLLSGDLEGVRRAMRFERWGAVIDSQLVVDGDRVLFNCDPGIEILGRSSRDWLDITELRLLDLPFEMRRYLHSLDVYEHDGEDVTTIVRTVDQWGDLDDVRAVLAWCDGRGHPVLTLPLESNGRDGDSMFWRGVGHLGLAPHRLVRRSDRGTVRVILTDAVRANSTPVRTRCAATSFSLGPLTRAPGATGVREERRERAELAWVATGESRGMVPLVRRLLTRPLTPPEPHLPAVADRVFIAYLPLSDLPEPWRHVPFDLDAWNDRFGGRAVLLLGGEHMPVVPFRMRGWAWDVRRMRVDRVIAVSSIVVTDDPLLLAAYPDSIAYRPDRGAARYLLPPLRVEVSDQGMLFDRIDAHLGGC